MYVDLEPIGRPSGSFHSSVGWNSRRPARTSIPLQSIREVFYFLVMGGEIRKTIVLKSVRQQVESAECQTSSHWTRVTAQDVPPIRYQYLQMYQLPWIQEDKPLPVLLPILIDGASRSTDPRGVTNDNKTNQCSRFNESADRFGNLRHRNKHTQDVLSWEDKLYIYTCKEYTLSVKVIVLNSICFPGEHSIELRAQCLNAPLCESVMVCSLLH